MTRTDILTILKRLQEINAAQAELLGDEVAEDVDSAEDPHPFDFDAYTALLIEEKGLLQNLQELYEDDR